MVSKFNIKYMVVVAGLALCSNAQAANPAPITEAQRFYLDQCLMKAGVGQTSAMVIESNASSRYFSGVQRLPNGGIKIMVAGDDHTLRQFRLFKDSNKTKITHFGGKVDSAKDKQDIDTVRVCLAKILTP